jgi:tetratricopeptide (TPR) repeat protein
MQSWCSQLAAGIVLALSLAPHTVATAAEDLSGLIAVLNQAWQQGRSKDVADRFDEALRVIPNDYRVHKAHGDFLTANRRNQEAVVAYRRAAELAPDAIEVHWAAWSLLDRMGEQDRAILSLKEIVRLDPENPLAHLQLAKVLRNVDHLEESVQSYQKAVELDPDHMTVRLQYARALFDVLQYDTARREVDTVLARAPKGSPDWAAAMNFLDLVKEETSDRGRRAVPNKNITIPGVDMALRGKQWALARGKAWQLMREERFTNAEAALRDVLRIMPSDYKAWYDLGLTLMELGRYEEALASFEEGFQVKHFGEWYPDSVFQIARCLVKLGRLNDAIGRFEHVLEIQDWREEQAYGMTFPDLAKVESALEEAYQHVPESRQASMSRRARAREKPPEPKIDTYTIPPFANGHELIAPVPDSTHLAAIGSGDAQGWFRQMVPARGVVQDDLPTGMQEFIPIAPTVTFAPDDPEIIIVFTLTSAPSDEIILNTHWLVERAGTVSPNTVIGTDRVLLTLNDKSGYVRLKRPQDGWPIGVYRVDFYLGDQVDAYTYTAEARFRVVAATQTH